MTHKSLSFIGCAPANRLPHTTGFPVNGLQDDILIYTSPILTVPQKKTWWIRNVQRFWFLKKKRIFPFLDDTLLLQNAYSATQVNSDPQGKGFLCKQKKKMFTETNWVIFHSVIYDAPLYTQRTFCARWVLSLQIWNSKLTVIRLWPHNDQTTYLQM